MPPPQPRQATPHPAPAPRASQVPYTQAFAQAFAAAGLQAPVMTTPADQAMSLKNLADHLLRTNPAGFGQGAVAHMSSRPVPDIMPHDAFSIAAMPTEHKPTLLCTVCLGMAIEHNPFIECRSCGCTTHLACITGNANVQFYLCPACVDKGLCFLVAVNDVLHRFCCAMSSVTRYTYHPPYNGPGLELPIRIVDGHFRINSRHWLYSRWTKMLGRTHDTSDRNYGGRAICGVWVYNDWQLGYATRRTFSPAAFLSYTLFVETVLLRPPAPGFSIDRINNDMGYVPQNLRWANPAMQTQNQRLRTHSQLPLQRVYPALFSLRTRAMFRKWLEAALRRKRTARRMLNDPIFRGILFGL